MANQRVFAGSTVLFGIAALLHATLTWPVDATIAFFGGGTFLAFLAEAIVINLRLLEHHVGPKLTGVPLYVLFAWTGVIYVSFRIALLVTDGWTAVATAAVIATSYDVLADPRGVADGHWTYIDDLPGRRYRGVPWWNFVGWFAISFVVSSLALPFL